MNNKYIIRSRISEAKTRDVIRYFSHDIEAVKISELTGLSRNTINKILKALRRRIAELCDAESIFKRGGKVYTQIVKNCSAKELYPIIKEHVATNVAVYTDCFKTYDGLVDFGYRKHYRVKHRENEFANECA